MLFDRNILPLIGHEKSEFIPNLCLHGSFLIQFCSFVLSSQGMLHSEAEARPSMVKGLTVLSGLCTKKLLFCADTAQYYKTTITNKHPP